MTKTKTYQVVTVTSVTIDFEHCKEHVMDAIENYLWDNYDIDCLDCDDAKVKFICEDILKEIAKNLLTN